MHHAPAVTYPVGRSCIWAVLGAALWLAGLSAVLAWAPAGGDPRAMAAALGLCGVTGVVALAGWWRSAGGELAWQPDGWRLHRSAVSCHGTPQVVMDLQASLLLRWHSAQGHDWLWLDRRTAPRQWDALRRAVYSRAIADAPSAGTAIS